MISKKKVIFVLLIVMLLSACKLEMVPVEIVKDDSGGYAVIQAGTESTSTQTSGTQPSGEPQTTQVPESSTKRVICLEQSTELIEYLEVEIEGKKELTAFSPVDWAFDLGPDETFGLAVKYPGENQEILQFQSPETPHVFWLNSEEIVVQLQIVLIDDPKKTVVAKSGWVPINNPAKPTTSCEGKMENSFSYRFVEPVEPLSVKINLETGKKYLPIPIEWKVSLEPGYYFRFVYTTEEQYLAQVGTVTPMEVLDNYLRVPISPGVVYVGWFEIINHHTQTVVEYSNLIRLPTK